MKCALAAILAVLLPAPAVTMPPPVVVSPLVLSAAGDAKNRLELVELIEGMAKEGHFTLAGISQDDAVLDDCWNGYPPRPACLARLAPVRVEDQAELIVVLDSPEWRQASLRVRCIGPDADRARSIELYLFDARTNRPNALQEKAKLAGCMISAIYGAPGERG